MENQFDTLMADAKHFLATGGAERERQILDGLVAVDFMTADERAASHIEMGCLEFDTVHVCITVNLDAKRDEDAMKFIEVNPYTKQITNL